MSSRPAPLPGLVCPHCGGGPLRVYYTRRRPGRILRVRICGGCRRV
jgi:hypothetical protein